MIKIKFSHLYNKMTGMDKTAILIAIFKVKLEDLHKSFLEYDTTYIENDGKGNLSVNHYPLPKTGDYMVLLLQSDYNKIWTTIRRWNPEKEDYYRSHLGEEVKIEVKE